ncbi:MAG TPA: tyramine oxidase [Thermoanaerobaculia bacterium]|jgi:primary-amine oxidase
MKSFGLAVSLAVLVMVAQAGAVLAAAHPLEPLSGDEYRAAYDIVREHFVDHSGLPDDGLLFPFVALREPSKAVVRNWSGAADFPREATVHVLHATSNRTWIVTVDLRAGRVAKVEVTPQGTQPAVTAEEYVVADEIVHAYEPWQAAMEVRGVNPDDVYVDVWAPGDQELPAAVVASLPHGSRTRLLRALAFVRGASVDDYDPENPQNPYVRPIEGVVVTIDMNQRRVVHMTDTLVRPVSRENGNATVRRTDLKPMKITQPNGGGFEMTGGLVRWQNWQFYPVLHPREGLVLYDVRYEDQGRLRPIAYRMSLSEIYVPYGVPDENWSWRSAFDVGEYNLGTFAQTLEPNRDVPEHTFLFDTLFGTDTGPAEDNSTGTFESTGTLGMYERDNGILWTRTDPSNAERDTRGRRELVLTWNAWIGNYIYGFDWIFGQDGTIEVKVVLTGATLNRGVAADAEEDEEGAPIVAIDDAGVRVAAPNHQHFFSFRLDLDVDGSANTVAETEVRHLEVPGFKNAFGAHETPLTTEGFRDADPSKVRHWEVSSATTENAVGKHPSYAIESNDVAVPLSAPDYEPLLRAAFASHAFWVTRFRDDELYAAGDFPNQGVAGAGLTSFISPPEPLADAGTDVVVWHTIGLTHVPRPEDYPVMPTESIGFKLLPHGFFDRNPALDAQELPVTMPRPRAVRRR